MPDIVAETCITIIARFTEFFHAFRCPIQAARFIAVSQPFALSTEPAITPVVSGALLDYDGVKEILFNLTAQEVTYA